MSGETETSVSGWTVDTFAAHAEALRQMQHQFDVERDRRYAEVALEREKALKIKEEADKAALGLAREIQTYKDEKANQLREQINSERGLYATKGDLNAATEKVGAQMSPLAEYIAADRGRGMGVNAVWAAIALGISILLGAFTLSGGFRSAPPNPQVIYVPAQPGTLVPSPSTPAAPR